MISGFRSSPNSFLSIIMPSVAQCYITSTFDKIVTQGEWGVYWYKSRTWCKSYSKPW